MSLDFNPSSVTEPECGIRSASIRRRTDFPTPDGPVTARQEPVFRSRSKGPASRYFRFLAVRMEGIWSPYRTGGNGNRYRGHKQSTTTTTAKV